jgi:hypothetical protein
MKSINFLLVLLIIINWYSLKAQNNPPHMRLNQTRYSSATLDNDWVNEKEDIIYSQTSTDYWTIRNCRFYSFI